MKTIITTYPDFWSLPIGVKKMLVESESFFFREAEPWKQKAAGSGLVMGPTPKPNRATCQNGPRSPFGHSWRN